MPARRLRLLAPLLAALALVLAGCGENGDEARKKLEKGQSSDGIREGLAVPVDGVRYNVYISRLINPRDPEDRQYYPGPDPKPGKMLFGVFIQACAPSGAGKPLMTTRTLSIEDILGDTFEPIQLPDSNVFAYRPVRLNPGTCEPNQVSASAYAPTGGSMLVFEMPVQAAENRPLQLVIEGVYRGLTGQRQIAKIDLDV